MDKPLKSRKEIHREYAERVKPAGVYQVKNLTSGKVLLGSSLNLEGPLNRHKFMLKIGSHPNKALQKDWDELGPEQFSFDILEEVQRKTDPSFNLKDELELLEMIWLEKVQPFRERCYNINERIREA
ncbi:MAG: LuxR family transcriptional regulator [Anaerolineae bacterium]|nr:MAG: LuxR family transcriptional regulator [Anaerolineae bacterium]WKZ43425.1 MAG: GIY-YIG nuclease family protein [Anaerolineales bacterium]